MTSSSADISVPLPSSCRHQCSVTSLSWHQCSVTSSCSRQCPSDVTLLTVRCRSRLQLGESGRPVRRNPSHPFPDGRGLWTSATGRCYFRHRQLARAPTMQPIRVPDIMGADVKTWRRPPGFGNIARVGLIDCQTDWGEGSRRAGWLDADDASSRRGNEIVRWKRTNLDGSFDVQPITSCLLFSLFSGLTIIRKWQKKKLSVGEMGETYINLTLVIQKTLSEILKVSVTSLTLRIRPCRWTSWTGNCIGTNSEWFFTALFSQHCY